MISERRQIAERFLSEGTGEASRIRGNRGRELNKIQSEAYRQVEEVRGAADAKATEIYAKAYNQSPEAVAFYEFTRTMQSYKSIIAENTTLVLSTDSDLFKFLKCYGSFLFVANRTHALQKLEKVTVRGKDKSCIFRDDGLVGLHSPGEFIERHRLRALVV